MPNIYIAFYNDAIISVGTVKETVKMAVKAHHWFQENPEHLRVHVYPDGGNADTRTILDWRKEDWDGLQNTRG